MLGGVNLNPRFLMDCLVINVRFADAVECRFTALLPRHGLNGREDRGVGVVVVKLISFPANRRTHFSLCGRVLAVLSTEKNTDAGRHWKRFKVSLAAKFAAVAETQIGYLSAVSETRFGEFLQFSKFLVNIWGAIIVWQIVLHYFGKISCFWANFQCCKWSNIEK